MVKIRTITLVLFATGILLFLVALLLPMSIGADVEGVPALQPSPRPPWNVTMTPAVQPTSPPPPPGPTSPPPSPTPTPIPTPVLLPNAGGASLPSGGLLGLGAGFILLGLGLTAAKKSAQHSS